MIEQPDEMRRIMAERIRIARTALDWTQDQLAAALGLPDRQTISTIESGERRVTADELVRLMAVLARPMEFFVDSDLIVEENFFSYRARRSSPEIEGFEAKARKLLELNRRLRTVLRECPPPTFTGVRGLEKSSPIETAASLGERFHAALELGPRPAAKLREAIATNFHVLILEIDAPADVSGAACHLEDGDVILLNRLEPAHRKNYTLGHEFFHLLTWSEMPPAKADLEDWSAKKPKVEQLADAFTASLLMPAALVQKEWESLHGPEITRVLAIARHFDVSGLAAYWRLVNCKLLRDPAREIARGDLSRREAADHTTQRLEKHFVERLWRALADGRMSVNLAAGLLEMTRPELNNVFAEHALPSPIDA